MLEELNTRVRFIAAIHNVLYGAADLSRIDFAPYLQTLIDDLASVYSGRAAGVRGSVRSGPVSLGTYPAG